MRKRIAIGTIAAVGLVTGTFFGGMAATDPTTSAEYSSLAEQLGEREAELGVAQDRLEDVQGDLTRVEETNSELQVQLEALTSEAQGSGVAQGEPAVSDGAAMAPRNLKIAIRTRSKECFGSAGCNVTIQIDPSYVGTQDVSTGSWEITYEIRGGEDGPLVETMTLEDGTFSFPAEQNLGTTSSTAKLEAVVTNVYTLS